MNTKDNLVRFPGPDAEHHDDAVVQKSPDPQELQRVFGQLVDALSLRPKVRTEREIRIRNFRSARFALTQDLIVVLEEEEEDGHCIAHAYDTGQYGYGFSPDDAILHLCSVLEDYYDLLVEDEGRLSPRLESHLRYLREALKERTQ